MTTNDVTFLKEDSESDNNRVDADFNNSSLLLNLTLDQIPESDESASLKMAAYHYERCDDYQV